MEGHHSLVERLLRHPRERFGAGAIVRDPSEAPHVRTALDAQEDDWSADFADVVARQVSVTRTPHPESRILNPEPRIP